MPLGDPVTPIAVERTDHGQSRTDRDVATIRNLRPLELYSTVRTGSQTGQAARGTRHLQLPYGPTAALNEKLSTSSSVGAVGCRRPPLEPEGHVPSDLPGGQRAELSVGHVPRAGGC